MHLAILRRAPKPRPSRHSQGADPTSHRMEATLRDGRARNAAEPIHLSTGSNDRVRGASPNRSHPTLSQSPPSDPSLLVPCSIPVEQRSPLPGRSERTLQPRAIQERAFLTPPTDTWAPVPTG